MQKFEGTCVGATRILVAELHCAAIRQPEVAELLHAWQHENAERLQRLAGLTPNQVRMYYLLLVGLAALLFGLGALSLSAVSARREMYSRLL